MNKSVVGDELANFRKMAGGRRGANEDETQHGLNHLQAPRQAASLAIRKTEARGWELHYAAKVLRKW